MKKFAKNLRFFNVASATFFIMSRTNSYNFWRFICSGEPEQRSPYSDSLRARRFGFRTPVGAIFPYSSVPAPRTTQLPVKWVSGVFVKEQQPSRGLDLPPLSRADGSMGTAIPLTLLWVSLFLYLISYSVCKQVTTMKFEYFPSYFFSLRFAACMPLKWTCVGIEFPS